MKKLLPITLFAILVSAQPSFAWWESGAESSPAKWSTSGHASGNTVDLEIYSKNSTPTGENYFVVDSDITLKSLKSVWQSSNQVLSMEKSDGGFGSITLDAAAYNSSGDIGMLALRGIETYGQNSLTIKNGTINFVNTNSAYTPSALIRLAENSTSTPNNKVLTFEKDSIINSELNLKIAGASTAEYPERSVINFNGKLSTETTNSDSKTIFKDVAFIKEGSSPYGTVTANFGSTSVSNIGRLSFSQDSRVTLASGAVINVNTQNQAFAKDSNNVYFGKNVVANINGTINVVSMSSMHGFNIDGATVNVGATGALKTNDGGYRNIQLQGAGTLDISAAATNAVSAGDGLRLNGGKLIVRSENAIKNLTVWIYDAAANKFDVYGKVNMDAFAFVANSKLEITLNSGAELWLNAFTVTRGGGWADVLGATNTITINNFENYKIHVGSYKATDDISRIFADNVEEGSFYWEADAVNGGYWLNANVIPESATIATIFGAIALGLAVYRRRK